jgi:predicted acylesterase/phospholipase RssA
LPAAEIPVKKSDKDANNRFALHRREMVLATAATFFPVHGASGETGSRNGPTDAGINADPAVPIPAAASLGTGKDRALVLGGGGEYFIAWLLGFAHGLRSAGVSYDLADVIVGTSAGALVGSSNIPISDAVCASASLPGVFGPTWIGDRLCMDGAICSTSTHVDLIAGAKRALVVALTDEGLRFSNIPNDIEQELKYVEAAGTRTLLIAADPGKVHLLSAAEIEPALKAGRDRAGREADRIKAFWA